MSTARITMKKGENFTHIVNLEDSDAKISAMLEKTGNTALVERAKVILRKILTKNARVYETDKAGAGLAAVSVYLACEEFAPTIGKKLTQKECQQQSDLGPKLFRRSLDLCRFAKDLDESKINFASLVRQFGGNEAQDYMDVIYKHFKKSCFDAGIVNETTWDSNHILVVCAIYCWVCDRVFPSPTYKGPEVAFHCGLGWENVQKSMYYNLNPHCTERMRELLERDKAKRMTHAIKADSNSNSTTKFMSGLGLGLDKAPSSRIGIGKEGRDPSRPWAPFNSRPHTPGSVPAAPPFGIPALGMGIPAPTPIPQGPYASASSTAASVPGYAIMDITRPKPTPPAVPTSSSNSNSNSNSRRPSGTGTETPMEIDLTALSDSESTTGDNARNKKKSSSGKRRDGDESSVSTPKPSGKRKTRNEFLSDEAWTNRTHEELFFKNVGESKVETELRVYYAWKRIIAEGNAEKGPEFGEGDIRDFVIT